MGVKCSRQHTAITRETTAWLILSLVILYYIVCVYHFRQYITFENEAQMRLENYVLMHCKRRRRIASHQISMRLRTSFFCSWVCLRSDRALTANEPLQGSFESVPRPPLQGGLGMLVWSAFDAHPSAICWILTCPNQPLQEGKRTLVRFNRTK